MKRLIPMSVAACLLISACGAEAPVSEQSPRSVLTMRISDAPFASQQTISGSLRASDRASLSFQVGGIIQSLNADLGDSVKPGDVLGRIDDDRARFALEARQADLLDAEAALADAQLDFDRRNSLAGTGAVSTASIDQAKARLDQAKARIAASRANVATARRQVADSLLSAPFSGEIVSRLAEPSQVVSAGQSIFEIVGAGTGLEAIINVPEPTLRSLTIGTPAQVRILANGTVTDASVIEMGRRANAAGLFPVTLALPEDFEMARAGQAVEISLPGTVSDTSPILVPIAAYAETSSKETVIFTLSGEQDRVIATPVRLGQIRGDRIEVLSGLTRGDVIVVKGSDLLENGQVVTLIDTATAQFGQ